MDEDRVCYSVQVRGRVQGVGFRYSTVQKAEQLGVAGWVRNEFDGSVRIECEGSRSRVDRFLEWVKRGPQAAHVTDVRKEERPPQGRARFTVKG